MASRTCSPPRMPVSQSWMTAVRGIALLFLFLTALVADVIVAEVVLGRHLFQTVDAEVLSGALLGRAAGAVVVQFPGSLSAREARKEIDVRRLRLRERVPHGGVELSAEVAGLRARVEEGGPGVAVARANDQRRRSGKAAVVPPVRTRRGGAD